MKTPASHQVHLRLIPVGQRSGRRRIGVCRNRGFRRRVGRTRREGTVKEINRGRKRRRKRNKLQIGAGLNRQQVEGKGKHSDLTPAIDFQMKPTLRGRQCWARAREGVKTTPSTTSFAHSTANGRPSEVLSSPADHQCRQASSRLCAKRMFWAP